jgi:hypothetical protein
MKEWNKIWELWKECNVPSIQTRKFVIGKNVIDRPWYFIERKEQIFFPENPILDTANHLAVSLKGKNLELIAAYKILAFLRYYNSQWILSGPLSHAMQKYEKQTYNWWNANARYVIPPCKNDNYSGDKFHEGDWKKIVLQAAETWKHIAKEWEIIIIPDFMDSMSEEYLAYKEYSKKIYEEREYQKYLRLKEKYEKE